MFRTISLLVTTAIRSWAENKAYRLGAALAFYSILSLGPLLVLALMVASHIWGQKAAQGQIISQMTGLIGENAASAIQNVLKSGAKANYQTSGLGRSILSFALLFFSASGFFGELQEALNIIWRVPKRPARSFLYFLRQQLFSVAMVISSSLLLLSSMLISALLTGMSSYINNWLPGMPVVMEIVDFVVSFGVVTMIFALSFKYIPEKKIRWKDVMPGALLTSALFVIGKTLIGAYLGQTNVASSYGAAGSVVVILVWVYYSSQILFFGAEFSHAYSELRKERMI